jgi:hypothetical protein
MDIEKKILQVKNLFKKTDRLPRVYLLHGELTDKQMNSVYAHPKVKSMYSLTKSEGFGRPLLEFATTSKPIIAPYHSGPVDFLKQDFICEVKGGLTNIHPTAQNDFLIGDAKWFTPDYKYAMECLRDVHKNYKKWLELAWLSGALSDVKLQDYERIQEPTFRGRGWSWVDPAKDMKAHVEGLAAGITTLTDIKAEQGIDIEDHFINLKKERELAAKYGIEPTWTQKKDAQPIEPVEPDEEK